MQVVTNSRKALGHNVLFQYGLQIAKYLFPFITLPYLTRVLGPEVYAVRAYILAAMTFMQVLLDYGFNSFGTKAIAECSSDRARIGFETSRIVLLRGALVVVGAVLLAAVTPFVTIMAENPAYVAIAYAGICFKATLPDFVFQGLEDMGIITKRFVVSQTVATVLTFVLVRNPQDLLWVPALEGLASFIAFAWSWDNVLRVRKIAIVRVGAGDLLFGFRQSTVFFLSNAATTVFTALTTLMIGFFISDPAEVSYWSVAMTAITAIQSLYTPITNSLYPHMVKRRDFALLKRLLIVGMAAVSVGSIAFACLSDVVMWILGGEQFVGGSYVVAMVSPVLWFSYPAMLLGFPVLAAVGQVRQLTVSSTVSALFHILGLAFLAFGGWFTIANVAVLRCLTEAVMLGLRVFYVARYFGEHDDGKAFQQ